MNRAARSGYIRSPREYLGTGREAFSIEKAAKTQVGDVVKIGERVLIKAALTLAPFDQGGLGSCEANAAIGGLMVVRSGSPMLSRLCLYQLALMRDRSWPKDAGTTGETVHNVLRDQGVCLESDCEYTDGEGWTERASILALQSAYDHRLDATYRIVGADIGAQVRASIDAGRPVQIGGPVSQAYVDYFGDLHEDRAFDSLFASVGGHAQLVVGYEPSNDAGTFRYVVRNSWGAAGMRSLPGHALYTERALRQCDEWFSFMGSPRF